MRYLGLPGVLILSDEASERLTVADPVSPSWSDENVPLAEWAFRLSAVGRSETGGPSRPGSIALNGGSADASEVPTAPAALLFSSVASARATPHEESGHAHVVPESELEDVSAIYFDLEVISVYSGVPSPSHSLLHSNPPSRQQMAENLSAYEERLRIHQCALVRQLPRSGRNRHPIP